MVRPLACTARRGAVSLRYTKEPRRHRYALSIAGASFVSLQIHHSEDDAPHALLLEGCGTMVRIFVVRYNSQIIRLDLKVQSVLQFYLFSCGMVTFDGTSQIAHVRHYVF